MLPPILLVQREREAAAAATMLPPMLEQGQKQPVVAYISGDGKQQGRTCFSTWGLDLDSPTIATPPDPVLSMQ